jgi:hypothetical protein
LRFYDLPKRNTKSRNPDTAITELEVTGPLGRGQAPFDRKEETTADLMDIRTIDCAVTAISQDRT